MDLRWLHISDFHFRKGDTYDSDVVLRALIKSVGDYRAAGRCCDLIFATGDIAQGGKREEYEQATRFFDALLEAAGLQRRHLFVVPGNHDVDRNQGVGLARTLGSREEADQYFAPDMPKPHLRQKLGAFTEWYQAYFAGIRRIPDFTTCGPVEFVQARGRCIGVLPLNSALFCQDDHDHAKLLLGRRCLDAALTELQAREADLNLALIHHPLDWLSDVERSNIKADLLAHVDAVLRGHLHETDIDTVASLTGTTLHFAAGATYQTRKWPNRALYVTLEESGSLRVFPIRYEDSPIEVWTVDPSVFPHDPGHERRLSSPRAQPAPPPPPAPPVEPQEPARFRSNIAARGDVPFLGRDTLLDDIARELADLACERVVVLHGPPGVGKSELAREFARRSRDRYPGGRFLVNGGAELADLARIGSNILGLNFPSDLPLADRCERTLLSMQGAATLLIFDNPSSKQAIEPWLPRSGMPCHVIVTTVNERWCVDWPDLSVPPLSATTSLELVEKIGGSVVAQRFGQSLATLSGGLPMQIVPASRALAYEERRGRLDSATLSMSTEASGSFDLVLDTLEVSVRLMLYAAAFLSQQRFFREELFTHLEEQYKGVRADFDRHLDVCLDLHLLEGVTELRMHQLLHAYLLRRATQDKELVPSLQAIRLRQRDRFLDVARLLSASPADVDLGGAILSYRLAPSDWDNDVTMTMEDRYVAGRGLIAIGRFMEASRWFERATTEAEQGDAHGHVNHQFLGASLHHLGYCLSLAGKFDEALPWLKRAVEEKEQRTEHAGIDHESLSLSLHQIGYCLYSVGKFEEAMTWVERAVVETEQGDDEGRIDHASLGRSLTFVGNCLYYVGKFDEALPWYERAVAEKELGDISGQIDHESLSKSLHQVGSCLSAIGRIGEAQPWFERAVTEGEQGDEHGRINHASVGMSLHEVGACLSRAGKFDEAQRWLERAVAQKELGDEYRRMDHEGVGTSLHQVGSCLHGAGKFDEAISWFERAVKEKEQGDVHGRINCSSVGMSLHQIGSSLYHLGNYDEAASWYERAAKAKEQGNVYGRINHESLSNSLYQVGYCIYMTGDHGNAQPWFERSVTEGQQGNEHGRIDHASMATSLNAVGNCLYHLGQFDKALPWYERAVAEQELVDVTALVDHESFSKSLHQIGACLSAIGKVDKAQPWFERAVTEGEKGDERGRIDRASVATSMYAVGCCLYSLGKFDEALPWFERAIAGHEEGNLLGRVTQADLDASIELIASCCRKTGRTEDLKKWEERLSRIRE